MLIRPFFLSCTVVLAGAAWAASPEVLTQPCAECHGATGISTAANAPHLNGQLVGYLEEETAGLAQGRRISGVANHVPKAWSGTEIAAVAKFYAKSKGARPVQATDPEMVDKGRALYQKRCAECHPDNGRQSDHDAPLMAGQNVDYLVQQVQAFVTGKRKFVFMMDDAFRGLSSTEFNSIAHFFASQDQYKK